MTQVSRYVSHRDFRYRAAPSFNAAFRASSPGSDRRPEDGATAERRGAGDRRPADTAGVPGARRHGGGGGESPKRALPGHARRSTQSVVERRRSLALFRPIVGWFRQLRC